MASLKVMGYYDPLGEEKDLAKQIDTLVNTPEIKHVRIMADKHLGYQSMPIGGVTVTGQWLAPGGAGFDIGCGNWAGRTGLNIANLTRDDLISIGSEIVNKIAFGNGVGYGTFADYPSLRYWVDATRHIGLPEHTIVNQFGSVGSGNHYIDLMADESGDIWVVLHFGSRKFGYSVAQHYLNILGAGDGMFSPPVFLDVNTDLGQEYLMDMQMAGEYAMVSRRLVGLKVIAQILQNTVYETVENHHNYIWKETHFGQEVFVTRKGSTPTYPGVPVFIGSSMATDSVIVEADDCEDNDILFKSGMHGSGRVIGRAQAKGKWNRQGEMTRAPRVTQEMMDACLEDAGVVVFGGGVEESPHVYRNLVEDVLPYYPWLKVKHLLRPVLVVMAPDEGKHGRK